MINAAPAVATAATTARKAMVRSVGAGVRPARRPDRGRTEATEALSRARWIRSIFEISNDLQYSEGLVPGGCSLEGQAWPKDWEYCIGGTVFKCDGNGIWVNQNRSC